MKITTTLTQIIKRDGRIEQFDPRKIANAIEKALKAVDNRDGDTASRLANIVVERLEDKFATGVPRVEDAQDMVEQVLMDEGFTEAAKAYILYRRRRADVREFKGFIGVQDDLKLGINAINVLKRRYLMKDEEGRAVETPSELLRRVARAVAAADVSYGPPEAVAETEEEFYQMMASLEFMPNYGSRVLYLTYEDPRTKGVYWGNTYVHVVQADGSALKEIYRSSEGTSASWSADGRAVYIREQNNVKQIAADGSGMIADLGGNPKDSTLSPDEAAQTSQASADIEEAVYQFALGGIRTFEGKPAESRAAFQASAEIFASLPWKYPLAGLSVDNCILFADSASAFTTRGDEAVLADSCLQRMEFVRRALRYYHEGNNAFPPDIKTLEDWAVNFTQGFDDFMKGEKRVEWTRLMFSCPGSEDSGPVPFIYRKSANVGEVILPCPNHPRNSMKLEEWMLGRH